MDYLGRNTIADLAKALEQKRRLIGKPRRTKRLVVKKSN
jgi:hypothetical protein